MMAANTSSALQPVPMLDFQREYRLIRDEVLTAIAAVCDSQQFILGPEVARFEQTAAQACTAPFAIGCASGTDALWLALASAGIGSRESAEPQAVLTTAFSFFATASAILRSGARPLLADIDPRSYNLCPDAVEQTLSQPGHRIAAILPVHLYGQCADMTALTAMARRYNLKLIEDAAQAFGAGWRLNASASSALPDEPLTRAGALGDAAAFSFYPTKNLSAFGDAGMVTTRSAEIAERATMLRVHGMRRRYFHDEVGWNSRMDTLQAAVLEVKLRRVEAGNARRRQIAARYDSLLRAAGLASPATSYDIADGIVLPFTDPRAEPIFHQYVIRAARRDALREYLSAHRIGSEVYYPRPLHLQHSLQSLGYREGDFPVSERAAAEVLALPIFPELRDDEVETVVEAIRRFYAGAP